MKEVKDMNSWKLEEIEEYIDSILSQDREELEEDLASYNETITNFLFDALEHIRDIINEGGY